MSFPFRLLLRFSLIIILQRFDYGVPWCSFLQIAWIWTGELPGPEGLAFTQCSFFHLLFLQIFLSPLLGLQFYVYSIPLQSLIADPFNFSPLSPCISFWIVSIPVSPHHSPNFIGCTEFSFLHLT